MAPGGDADEVLLTAPLKGPQLEDGWRWVREDGDGWRFGEDGLEIATNPGGLGAQASSESSAPPLLLRSLLSFGGRANACEVTVTMPSTRGGLHEQAGLFWYLNDSNYAKLVIEFMQDGTASIILAREQRGEYVVHATAQLDEEEAHEATRLRLEMSADGSQLNGCVVGAYYTRLIGNCPASSNTWGDNEGADTALSFGISAHGGAERGRMAKFAKFAAVAIKANRVQWANAAATVPQSLTAAPQTQAQQGGGYAQQQQPSAPPAQEGYAPPAPGGNLGVAAPGGWTLSADLTAEQRAQIAGMLAMEGLPSIDDPGPQQH